MALPTLSPEPTKQETKASVAPAVVPSLTAEQIRKKEWEEAHQRYEQAVESRREELARRIAEHYKISPVAARKIVDAAHDAGPRYNVDPLMLLSISAVESNFNPSARSSAGAVGLTQTLPRAHPEKLARIRATGRSPTDVSASLELGAEVYAEYRAKFRGDKIKALQQYNGSLRDSSRRYSNKVMAAHAVLSQGLPILPPKPLETALDPKTELAVACSPSTERC